MTRDRLLAVLLKLGPGEEHDSAFCQAPSPPWQMCALCGSKYHTDDCELAAAIEWLEDAERIQNPSGKWVVELDASVRGD